MELAEMIAEQKRMHRTEFANIARTKSRADRRTYVLRIRARFPEFFTMVGRHLFAKPKPRYFALVIEAQPGAELGNILQGSGQLWEHLDAHKMAVEAAASHLRCALGQTIPSDDKIIIEHVQKALEHLGPWLPKGCRVTRSIEISSSTAKKVW